MFSNKHTLDIVLAQKFFTSSIDENIIFFSIEIFKRNDLVNVAWPFFMNVFWHFFTHTCIKNSADIDQ